MLVDTNIWLASADRRPDRHADCAALVRGHVGRLASPVPVIAETSWLLLDRLGPSTRPEFVRMVSAGRLQALDLAGEDWRRCAELVERYADMRLDLMDASLVALAERLGEDTIATLNRRDFTVVRARHLTAFELVP
ncbi:MAG TPA: PIN domain-containing protein [Acidimicrobiales bacterium]|nr:PIN domain-containing protein [Acidimicrobiales bacterium]